MKRLLALAAGTALLGVATLVSSAPAFAANGTFSLAGDASATSGGLQLTSSATPPGYGALVYTPSTPLTLGGFTNLSATFQALAGGCGGGSPRFAVETPSGTVFVYLGTPPNFTCSVDGTTHSTGNLLSGTCDTSQLGGTFYDACSSLATSYAALQVTGIALVVDGGWAAGGTQSFLFTSVTVNSDTFPTATQSGPPTSREQCLNGGWQQFTNPTFRNQGECVSYVNHHRNGGDNGDDGDSGNHGDHGGHGDDGGDD